MAVKPDNISSHGESAAGEPRAAPRYRYSSAPAATAAASVAGPVGDVVTLNRTPMPNWDRVFIALVAAGFCLVALYPSELLGLQAKWYSDAGWSHGFVVPLISLFLIRNKWEVLRELSPVGTWSGLALLLLGVGGQVLFHATGTIHMSNLSILVLLLGLVLFVFGWEFLKILWLPIGYLVFAIPPPGALYTALTTPMQQIAAEVGVWFLPLFATEGHRTGTIIQIAKAGGFVKLDVEQACSGMRMLVAFLALAVALAYSTSRPMWQKVFLAVAAVPIAILCNALRVTLTGVMVAKVSPDWGEGNAHAYFGLLMLIPALFLQLGLGWALDHLFVETEAAGGGGGEVAGVSR